jgi:hypothetical protein
MLAPVKRIAIVMATSTISAIVIVMMLVMMLVSGCGGALPSSVWPRSAGTATQGDWAEDGGEPIDPKGTSPLAAIEHSAEPAVDEAPAEEASAADIDSVVPESTPRDDAAPAPAPEEIQLGEEIIIEITD